MATTTQVTLSDNAESYIKSQIPTLKNQGVLCEATGKPYTIRELASKLIDDAIAALQTVSETPEDNGEIVQFHNWLDLAKSNVGDIREHLSKEVYLGNVDPIKLLIAINSFSKVFIGAGRDKGVKGLIMEAAVEEFQKSYGSGKHMIQNFEVEQAETGVKYNYSNDPVWQELNDELKVAQERIKAREERLKAAKKPDILKGEEYDTEIHKSTGEMITIEPPIKTSTTVLKCTLKN